MRYISPRRVIGISPPNNDITHRCWVCFGFPSKHCRTRVPIFTTTYIHGEYFSVELDGAWAAAQFYGSLLIALAQAFQWQRFFDRLYEVRWWFWMLQIRVRLATEVSARNNVIKYDSFPSAQGIWLDYAEVGQLADCNDLCSQLCAGLLLENGVPRSVVLYRMMRKAYLSWPAPFCGGVLG